MNKNRSSKFLRRIQILPYFHKNRRYLDQELEIEKSVPSKIFSHLSSLRFKKAFVDILNSGPTKCHTNFENLTLKTTQGIIPRVFCGGARVRQSGGARDFCAGNSAGDNLRHGRQAQRVRPDFGHQRKTPRAKRQPY